MRCDGCPEQGAHAHHQARLPAMMPLLSSLCVSLPASHLSLLQKKTVTLVQGGYRRRYSSVVFDPPMNRILCLGSFLSLDNLFRPSVFSRRSTQLKIKTGIHREGAKSEPRQQIPPAGSLGPSLEFLSSLSVSFVLRQKKTPNTSRTHPTLSLTLHAAISQPLSIFSKIVYFLCSVIVR